MRDVTSCGILLVRDRPRPAFLVLRLYRTHDLPKGLRENGEADLACALRELTEETGLPLDAVELLAGGPFCAMYPARLDGEAVRKHLVVFPARLVRSEPIVLTEHHAYAWHPWERRAEVRSRILAEIVGQAERVPLFGCTGTGHAQSQRRAKEGRQNRWCRGRRRSVTSSYRISGSMNTHACCACSWRLTLQVNLKSRPKCRNEPKLPPAPTTASSPSAKLPAGRGCAHRRSDTTKASVCCRPRDV